MSGFGFAIAGALSGLGKGIVEDAIATRDQAFKEAEAQANHRRAIELDNNQNANLSAREERDRAFRAEQDAEERKFRADEGEKNRSLQGRQYGEDENGNTIIIEGDKAKPVIGADGNPVRIRPKGQSETDFDKKYRLGMEIYGDKEAAANFAAGIKAPSAADKEKMAMDLAEKRSQSPLGGVDSKKFDSELERARKELDALFASDTRRKPAAEATGTESEPGSGAKAGQPSQADVVKQAQAAIAKGASKDAVRQRMQELGVDPSLAGL